MVIHEMFEPLPVETPLGKGLAILVECNVSDYKWTVVLESRALVTFQQKDILVQRDFTNDRGITADMLREIIDRKLQT